MPPDARGAGGLPRAYTLLGVTQHLVRPGPQGNQHGRHALSESACRRLGDRPTQLAPANHPDAYLFGILAEAELYIGHDERAPLWLQRREAAFASIEQPTARPAGATSCRSGWTVSPRNQRHRYRIGVSAGATALGQAGFITVGDTPPVNPREGDGWWDSVGAQLYIWYNDGSSAAWVPATNTSGTAISSLRTEAPISGAVIVMTAADQALAITSGALAA